MTTKTALLSGSPEPSFVCINAGQTVNLFAMLYEIKNIKQYPGEPVRRWFYGHYFDLTVWFDDRDEIISFQLCYNKPKDQHALTWDKDTGYRHNRVDDGEGIPFAGTKEIPILLMNGHFEYFQIAEMFKLECCEIEDRISTFIYHKIIEYPSARP